jgi:hypothetical protein
MIISMVLGAVAGMAMALFFRAPALIALSLLAAGAAGVVWIVAGWSLLDGLLRVGGLLATIQVSYLMGLGMAALLAWMRQARRSSPIAGRARSGRFVPTRESSDRPHEDHQVQAQ